MKLLFYLFFIFIFIDFVNAASIAVSPGVVDLRDGTNEIVLFNPNEFSVNFSASTNLPDVISFSRSNGIIYAKDRIKLSLKANDYSGNLEPFVIFNIISDSSDGLAFAPGVGVRVILNKTSAEFEGDYITGNSVKIVNRDFDSTNFKWTAVGLIIVLIISLAVIFRKKLFRKFFI